MFRKKIYGQSKMDRCPFCRQRAVTENSQGVPVCVDHKEGMLDDLKCVCGGWLDVRKGKFGPYFFCMNCGNVNFKRGLEMNDKAINDYRPETNKSVSDGESKFDKKVREITVTSDEVDFL